MIHPLDYETPRRPRPPRAPHPSARSVWPDPVASILSFVVACLLTWAVWYVARWSWPIMVSLFTALVVAGEWFAVGIERRRG